MPRELKQTTYASNYCRKCGGGVMKRVNNGVLSYYCDHCGPQPFGKPVQYKKKGNVNVKTDT
jgi:ribosomal protein L37AE/L43A